METEDAKENPLEVKRKQLSDDQIKKLKKPLPKEAIKPHPTQTYLSTIKVIYVVERLNEVFGLGGWYVENKVVDRQELPVKEGKNPKSMIVVESVFSAPEYGIRIPMYGGNDNPDLGDAYKGACTDALSKIGSYLFIGMDVYKGLPDGAPEPKSNGKEPEEISGIIEHEKQDDQGRLFWELSNAIIYCVEDSTEADYSRLIQQIGKKATVKGHYRAKKGAKKVYEFTEVVSVL
jgi:hypothetical protein